MGDEGRSAGIESTPSHTPAGHDEGSSAPIDEADSPKAGRNVEPVTPRPQSTPKGQGKPPKEEESQKG